MAVRLALWLTHGSWLLIQITEVIRILKFAEGSCKVLGHWLTPSWLTASGAGPGLAHGAQGPHSAAITEAGPGAGDAGCLVIQCANYVLSHRMCVSSVSSVQAWALLASDWSELQPAVAGLARAARRGQAVSPEPQTRPGRATGRGSRSLQWKYSLSYWVTQPSPHHRLSRESGKWFLQASQRQNWLNSALKMIAVKSVSQHRTRNLDKLRNMSTIQWIKKTKTLVL